MNNITISSQLHSTSISKTITSKNKKKSFSPKASAEKLRPVCCGKVTKPSNY